MNPELFLAYVAPAAKSSGWLDQLKGGNLPFNWFDIAVLVILIVGFTRGRKHGMSVEMMHLLQWIFIIFGAAWAYLPGGDYIASVSPVSRLVCYIAAYVSAAICIRIVFSIFRRLIGGKLLGSNLFGAAEYYLGMGAGIVRFACIIIFVLAIINARLYTVAEIKAADKYNKDVYGSNFFPDLHTVQVEVFQRSFIGPVVRQHLGFFLIKPTPTEHKAIKRAGDFELK